MDITGIGIGRSIAIGPIIRMAPALKEPEDITNSQGRDSLQEVDRAQTSLKKVAEDLRLQAKRAQGSDMNGGKTQEILEALAQMAADPALLESITRLIEQGKTAERAVFEGFSGFEQTLTALGGYMAERAGDLHDVGQRVIADLLNIPVPGVPTSDHPFVLVAQDLSPADTAALDMSKILAIVTAQGGRPVIRRFWLVREASLQWFPQLDLTNWWMAHWLSSTLQRESSPLIQPKKK